MNRKIVVATLVIGASGIVNSWNAKPPKAITPVILGTYVFMLVLALLDAFGGPIAQLAGALAMLAMLTVILTEFPWGTILGLVGQGKKA